MVETLVSEDHAVPDDGITITIKSDGPSEPLDAENVPPIEENASESPAKTGVKALAVKVFCFCQVGFTV